MSCGIEIFYVKLNKKRRNVLFSEVKFIYYFAPWWNAGNTWLAACETTFSSP